MRVLPGCVWPAWRSMKDGVCVLGFVLRLCERGCKRVMLCCVVMIVASLSVCPSGLRGYVQVVMFSNAWVQIPQLTNPLLSLTTKCCNAYSRAVISAFYLMSFSCSQAQTRRLRSTNQAAHHLLGTFLAITVAVCLHHCRICQMLSIVECVDKSLISHCT